MAGPYGDAAKIKKLIGPKDDTPFAAGDSERIEDLRKTVSLEVEHLTGAVFNEPNTSKTKTVRGDGTANLWLPSGTRSVTSITENPTWDGTSWTGGQAIAASKYLLEGLRDSGAYGRLERYDGIWLNRVRYVIVGTWEESWPTIPDDIHYVVNYVAAFVWMKQRSGLTGQIGPDGAVLSIRDTLRETEIATILRFYQLNTGPLAGVA